MWSERQPPNYLALTLRSRVYDFAKETPYEVEPDTDIGSGVTRTLTLH